MSPNTNIDQNAIRTRAHELWQERGCPLGSAEEDWIRAEHELSAAAKNASDRAPTSSKARIRAVSAKPAAASATRPKTLAG